MNTKTYISRANFQQLNYSHLANSPGWRFLSNLEKQALFDIIKGASVMLYPDSGSPPTRYIWADFQEIAEILATDLNAAEYSPPAEGSEYA